MQGGRKSVAKSNLRYVFAQKWVTFFRKKSALLDPNFGKKIRICHYFAKKKSKMKKIFGFFPKWVCKKFAVFQKYLHFNFFEKVEKRFQKKNTREDIFIFWTCFLKNAKNVKKVKKRDFYHFFAKMKILFLELFNFFSIYIRWVFPLSGSTRNGPLKKCQKWVLKNHFLKKTKKNEKFWKKISKMSKTAFFGNSPRQFAPKNRQKLKKMKKIAKNRKKRQKKRNVKMTIN